MRFLILVIAILLVTACQDPRPVVDLKASRDARAAQTDMHECAWLSEHYALDRGFAIGRCLEGRGHSFLGHQGDD